MMTLEPSPGATRLDVGDRRRTDAERSRDLGRFDPKCHLSPYLLHLVLGQALPAGPLPVLGIDAARMPAGMPSNVAWRARPMVSLENHLAHRALTYLGIPMGVEAEWPQDAPVGLGAES